MARADLLSILYTRHMSALDFKFEALQGPNVYDIFDPYDIRYMKSITSHPKLVSKLKEKTNLLCEVMEAHNFKKTVQGTNRICFKSFSDSRIVAKVALDDVGLKDNPAEYKNQDILKPFVTKVFSVSEFGEIGIFERVDPVTSRQQFLSIASDVFDLLNKYISGKYVLEDIGSDYFLNYGIRKGFGPVLLDFPYVYEIDGKKLICNNKDSHSETGYCMGEIDYDIGFNNLICTKCGKRYFAIDLKKDEENKKIIIQKHEGGPKMKLIIARGDEILKEKELGRNINEIDFIPKKKTVKISYGDDGSLKEEEVINSKEENNKEETIKSDIEDPKHLTVTVGSIYKDFGNNKKNKDKNKKKKYFNNKGSDGKYPTKNSTEYYSNRNQNDKYKYNSNTSVNDFPKLDNVYKGNNIIKEENVKETTNEEAKQEPITAPIIDEVKDKIVENTYVNKVDNTLNIEDEF